MSSDQTLTLGYNAATQIVSRQNSNTNYQWSPLSAGTNNYADNGLNQYTSVGGTNQSYDSRGNLTTGGYGYDIFNRLVSGPNSAALSYDPLGRLYQAQNASIAATRFLYDNEQVIAEYNTSGTLLRRYVPGPGIDEPIVWYEGSGTSDRRWLIPDQLGSITAVTDGSGAATTINTYDEYGVQGSSNAGRFQFTGQMWLPEIGVYHYRARAYSSALGRFLQTDPILYDGGMNLYAYVGNDPVNRRDPSGLADCISVPGSLIRRCGDAKNPTGTFGAALMERDARSSFSRDDVPDTLLGTGSDEGVVVFARPGLSQQELQGALRWLRVAEIPSAVPESIPGGPWTPAGPGQPPGTFYGPRQQTGARTILRWVPPESEGGPPGSRGYWKTKTPGQGGWDRYNRSGQWISPEEAHPGNPSLPFLSLTFWAVLLGILVYSTPAE